MRDLGKPKLNKLSWNGSEDSVIEPTKTAIAWTDLTYKVGLKKKKTILDDLNGSVAFGTITALMGPSGAGKTTLLKCLNGKLSSGLQPNSRIFVSNSIEIIPGFVGQYAKEQLFMSLTAKQNLIYASKLKNSSLKSAVNHNINVENIMNELVIDDIGDTPVEKCSGGQQKRLTIAIEMTPVVKPNVLCVDEPTTGLDSNVAEMVMNCLRVLSEKHSIAVVTSIHQPNHEIVTMFNKIYALAKGGHCVYSGTPYGIGPYLKQTEIIYNQNQVPIEQLLKLSSIDTKNPHMNQLVLRTKQALVSEISQMEAYMKISPNGIEFYSKAFKFIDIWHIMSRSVTHFTTSLWKTLLMFLVFYVVLPITTASMFNQDIARPDACFHPFLSNKTCAKDVENDSNLRQNQLFLFFVFILAQFVQLSYSTVTYMSETKVFISEHNNRCYSILSYFISKTITEIIPTIVFSQCFGFFSYYWSGQPFETNRMLGYLLLVMLSFICTESLGHIAGIILDKYMQISVMASLGVFVGQCMLCGFYISIEDMPLVLQYVAYWSYTRFVTEGIMIVIYGLDRCPPGLQSVVLNKYNIADKDLYQGYYKLVIYILVLRIAEYVCLYLKSNLDIGKLMRRTRIRPIDKGTSETELPNTVSVKQVLPRRRLTLIVKVYDDLFDEEDDDDTESKYKDLMCIAWTDLTLRIPTDLFLDDKVILNKINGHFDFCTLNALMGGSGAGKTSLLKSLNGFHTNYLTYDTKIYFSKYRNVKTCFITQNERDHLMSGITAGQAMMYASKLKNRRLDFDHKKNVELIMKELLIYNTFSTNVEKCSGGEQKRLAIGMELTAGVKPNLMCIDEPTSGLDSYAAEVVMRCLKRLTERHGLCIITSIHQPNSEILTLFNKIYVLGKGGHCIYSGGPEDVEQCLKECGAQVTSDQVPAESVRRYSCFDLNNPTVKRMAKRANSVQKRIQKRIICETDIVIGGLNQLSKRFFLRDIRLLVMRRLTSILWLNWRQTGLQFAVYVLIAVTFKLLYGSDITGPSGCIDFEDDYNKTCARTARQFRDEQLLMYNVNYHFLIVLIIIFFGVIMPVFTIGNNINLFFNEHRNGWYSTGAYYWSQSVVDILQLAITLLCYSLVVNNYDVSMFLWYLFFFVLGALIAQPAGQIIAIVFSGNQRMAVFASMALISFFVLFSNFVIPNKELHYLLQNLSQLSPIKLILESILLLQYGFDRCTDREFSLVLYLLDIEDKDFYTNTKLLIIHFFFYRILSVIALLAKVNPISDSKKEHKPSIEFFQDFF